MTIPDVNTKDWKKALFEVKEGNKRIYTDYRLLVSHKEKNCECDKCFRQIYKLPPKETLDELRASFCTDEKTAKRAKKAAAKEVKKGKQHSIKSFLINKKK